MVYVFLRFLSFLLAKIFLKFKVYGKENIPAQGGFILASNHVSFLDPILVGVACPRPCNYMARHTLFRNFLFAWLLAKLNVFRVKRNSADLAALRQAVRMVKSGNCLVIFPEGSRQSRGALNYGVGFLAAKFNLEIIPVFVKGTDLALPAGAKFIKRADVVVYFGRQLKIDRSESYEVITQKIMQEIKSLKAVKNHL